MFSGLLGYFAVVIKSYYDIIIANRIQSVLPVTDQPAVTPILVRFSRFSPQQQCTEFRNEPPLAPSFAELPTEPRTNY